MEQRKEQAKPESLAANKMVAMMMDTMGYVPDRTLGKNLHYEFATSRRPTARTNLMAAQTKTVENRSSSTRQIARCVILRLIDE
jgi:hypothetical protein